MIRNRRSRNRTDENLGGMRMKKTLSLLLSLVLMLSLALPASAAETEYPTLEGGVTEIQKYGNIVLDIDPADLKDGGYTYGDLLTVTVNGTGYDMPLCTNYSDVDTGALVLRDSEGVLIAAINMGDFATSNGLAAKVTLVAPKSIVRSEGKAVRVIDKRKI